MYIVKGDTQYGFILISAVFVSFIFNLFVRQEYDFSYILMDLNDMASIVSRDRIIIVSSVAINRIKQIFIILLLFKAFGANKVYDIFMILGGGILGLVVSVQLHYLGITGLLILVGFMFPHYIVYYFAIGYGYRLKLFCGVKEGNLKNTLCVCAFFVLGIIIECISSTFFLKFFYQHMVS